MQQIKDIDIRTHLLSELNILDSLIIKSEMLVGFGAARVDIAIIKDSINGIEIKSEADNLSRLAKQIEAYNRLFKEVTLITCYNHLEDALKLVPDFWGVSLASIDNGVISIKEVKKPKSNCDRDSFTMAQLLWKQEAIDILADAGILETKMKYMPRFKLWRIIGDSFTPDKLEIKVINVLKKRTDWVV